MATVILVAAACGSSPSPTPSGPAAASPKASNDAGFIVLQGDASSLAGQPSATNDVLGDESVTVLKLRESLGTEADRILALVAATEAAARAKAQVNLSGSRAKPTNTDAIVLATVTAPAAPPPDTELREVLPGVLDAVGRPGATSIEFGPDTATASASDAGSSATTEMTTSGDAVIEGSKATVTIKRQIHSAVTAGGATVLDKTQTYTAAASLNVCPTSAGISEGSVNLSDSEDASTFAGAGGRVGSHATGTRTSASTFRGQVDDSATLGNVSQDYDKQEEWHRTASAAGGPEATSDGTYAVGATGIGVGVPASHKWGLQAGDWSGANGSATKSGDASDSLGNSTVMSAAFDYSIIDQAYVAAQKLWRHGRCVMVTAPSYNLETGIDGGGSHTEEVDKGSTTEVQVGLKHRFGDSLSATILTKLVSGDQSVSPDSIEKPPGTLSYVAPDEDGKDASVEVTSTSKQGIGMITLVFHTGLKGLKVSISGTVVSSGGGISFTTRVSIPSVVLRKLPDGTYAGSGAATSTISIANRLCPAPFHEKATIKLTATRPPADDPQLPQPWLVKWDSSSTKVTTSGTCLGFNLGSLFQLGDAGYTGIFMTVIGTLEFNPDGGEKEIKKNQTTGVLSNSLDATANALIVSGSGQ